MNNYSLVLPEEFSEYASEVEAKGWFAEARLTFGEKRYQINFYDPVRLRQEIETALQRTRAFFEPNLVVVPSVTPQNMKGAIEELIQSGALGSLSAE